MAIKLKDNQLEAIRKMKPGCILCGDTGSGKSLTSIAYYLKYCGFDIKDIEHVLMENINRDSLYYNLIPLYIITTPAKRDKYEWDMELAKFCLQQDISDDSGKNKVTIVVDSWNNIKKYEKVCNSFFIFDEQRVSGSGVWVKTFLKISKNNKWILLSATPGDVYMDYVPVLIANGFYKNKTEFCFNHVIWSRFTKYPKPERYIRTDIIDKYINNILVPMPTENKKMYIITELECQYDKDMYSKVIKERWNPYTNEPIQTSAEFCKVLRTINNSDISRLNHLREVYKKHKRLIVFYNFNFELDLILSLKKEGIIVTQWNGHKHEDISLSDSWIHAVQYFAGNEGWNCILTDTMVFYSNNYSYRVMKQSAGRIDRLNSPYSDLYYYLLLTDSKIERSIMNAIHEKREFNEKKFSANFGI